MDDEFANDRLHPTTYARMTKRLEERREALESAPVASQEPVWVGTGQTYRERWNGLPEAQRAKEMRHAGFRLYVAKTKRVVDIGFQVHEYELS